MTQLVLIFLLASNFMSSCAYSLWEPISHLVWVPIPVIPKCSQIISQLKGPPWTPWHTHPPQAPSQRLFCHPSWCRGAGRWTLLFPLPLCYAHGELKTSQMSHPQGCLRGALLLVFPFCRRGNEHREVEWCLLVAQPGGGRTRNKMLRAAALNYHTLLFASYRVSTIPPCNGLGSSWPLESELYARRRVSLDPRCWTS